MLPYSLATMLTIGGLFYLDTFHPDLAKTLMIKIDPFGLTPEGAAEKQRVAEIKALPIPYEKKQVLLEHTIFMGATKEMVRLALGDPKKMQRHTDESGEVQEIWIYVFRLDKRPTMLAFEKDTLASAYKGSMLDVIRDGTQHEFSGETQ